MLYRHVLAIFGPDTAPFALIARAEAQHAAALSCSSRGGTSRPILVAREPGVRTIPRLAARALPPKWPTPRSTPYLERTDLPQDVRNVFTNLQAASLRHLPAFERCQ
jgi:hypothetical protein